MYPSYVVCMSFIYTSTDLDILVGVVVHTGNYAENVDFKVLITMDIMA